MKVLSIKEPYATLIKEQKKKVETRSWETNYRGKIYIHASFTKMNKESQELLNLLDVKTLEYGAIICKCELTDCVYMTKEYVENMKKNNYQEYICGDYKEGRYAWILENIKPLNNPIKVKGHLGLWNYYNEVEIMNLMQDIKYGWVDKEKKKHHEFETFSTDYLLQSPKQLIKSQIGVCWDQVELERYYFKNTNLEIKTFFIINNDEGVCPTHTFLVYEKNNEFYWFEHSWEKYRGIFKYNNLDALLKDVKNKFISDLENKSILNISLYEYPKVPSSLNPLDYMNFVQNSRRVYV